MGEKSVILKINREKIDPAIGNGGFIMFNILYQRISFILKSDSWKILFEFNFIIDSFQFLLTKFK